MYKIIRNEKYDFLGQSYSTSYPNIHRYPATMIPQIGIELFKELGIKKGKLLDPYCGSGSSFIVGLDSNIKGMFGCDINPLAVLISKAKFTKVNISVVAEERQKLRNNILKFIKKESNIDKIKIPEFRNISFWFSKKAVTNLSIVRHFIEKIPEEGVKRLFLVPFSETIRKCSYTRIGEFKLYRIKPEKIKNFNPDVFTTFFDNLNNVIETYKNFYLPKLKESKIEIETDEFKGNGHKYNIVLTSPPYGDSRTTVAYGQFSMFSNEWLGCNNARQIDNMLMGGKNAKQCYDRGVIAEYILKIKKESEKRALEVSSFYYDLEKSINNVAKNVAKGGISIYVVGNRRVKGIQLPTDQFIAEKFEENKFKHILTYERLIGNKSMPLRNSPTNKIGKTLGTMTREYIVVCKKTTC